MPVRVHCRVDGPGSGSLCQESLQHSAWALCTWLTSTRGEQPPAIPASGASKSSFTQPSPSQKCCAVREAGLDHQHPSPHPKQLSTAKLQTAPQKQFAENSGPMRTPKSELQPAAACLTAPTSTPRSPQTPPLFSSKQHPNTTANSRSIGPACTSRKPEETSPHCTPSNTPNSTPNSPQIEHQLRRAVHHCSTCVQQHGTPSHLFPLQPRCRYDLAVKAVKCTGVLLFFLSGSPRHLSRCLLPSCGSWQASSWEQLLVQPRSELVGAPVPPHPHWRQTPRLDSRPSRPTGTPTANTAPPTPPKAQVAAPTAPQKNCRKPL